MGYVTDEENWYEIPRADPANDQVAAGVNMGLDSMIAATKVALRDTWSQGGTDVEAMAAMSISMKELVDDGTFSVTAIVNALTAALVRLSRGTTPIELPPL